MYRISLSVALGIHANFDARAFSSGAVLEGINMIYSIVGLTVIGAAAGLAFRWKVLLPIIVLLPFAGIIFSISRSLNYVDTVIVILVAEAVLQGGYFAGLLIRGLATAAMRFGAASISSKTGRAPQGHDKDSHTDPQADR